MNEIVVFLKEFVFGFVYSGIRRYGSFFFWGFINLRISILGLVFFLLFLSGGSCLFGVRFCEFSTVVGDEGGVVFGVFEAV